MQLVNMASTQRARNDAEPSAVAKVLRAELANGIDPTQFMMTNLEKSHRAQLPDLGGSPLCVFKAHCFSH